jgi:hypothetical protein
MTIQAKEFLRKSIEQYRGFSEDKKLLAKQSIALQIKMHEASLNTIGIGFCEWQVSTAKIFLRIFKNE